MSQLPLRSRLHSLLYICRGCRALLPQRIAYSKTSLLSFCHWVAVAYFDMTELRFHHATGTRKAPALAPALAPCSRKYRVFRRPNWQMSFGKLNYQSISIKLATPVLLVTCIPWMNSWRYVSVVLH